MSPRRQPDPWPNSADTPLQRREEIGRWYRRALSIVAPDTCAQLDEQAIKLGHSWIRPKPDPYEPMDQLTAELVADWCGVRIRTVDRWREQGLRCVATPEGPRYVFADVEAFMAARRAKRRY